MTKRAGIWPARLGRAIAGAALLAGALALPARAQMTEAQAAAALATHMAARQNALLTWQPELRGLLDGRSGRARAHVIGPTGQLTTRTRAGGPVWANLGASWSAGETWGRQQAALSLGSHVYARRGLVVGTALVLDHLHTLSGGIETTGGGWMGGGYLVARRDALRFDARALTGRTQAQLASGAARLTMPTERWLATARLTSRLGMGRRSALTPSFGLEWAQDGHAGRGAIAPDRVSRGQVTAGLGVATRLEGPLDVQLTGNLTQVWQVEDATDAFSASHARWTLGLSARPGEKARAEFGLSGAGTGRDLVAAPRFSARLRLTM